MINILMQRWGVLVARGFVAGLVLGAVIDCVLAIAEVLR